MWAFLVLLPCPIAPSKKANLPSLSSLERQADPPPQLGQCSHARHSANIPSLSSAEWEDQELSQALGPAEQEVFVGA